MKGTSIVSFIFVPSWSANGTDFVVRLAAVDEKVSISGHLKVIEWIYTLIQNAVRWLTYLSAIRVVLLAELGLCSTFRTLPKLEQLVICLTQGECCWIRLPDLQC